MGTEFFDESLGRAFLLNAYTFMFFFNYLLSTTSILICSFHKENEKQTFRLTHLEMNF